MNRHSRRTFLHLGSLTLTALAIANCTRQPSSSSRSGDHSGLPVAQAQPLSPTPSCGEETTLTQPAGPFYLPDSPQRTSLVEPGERGPILVLVGYVLGRDCRPIANALVDIWHADPAGRYDTQGQRFRGHQFTDAAGRYTLETNLPGLYPGRTRHLHVKVQAPQQSVLTTQLYFPGEAENASDRLFQPALMVALAEGGDRRSARFDFVI